MSMRGGDFRARTDAAVRFPPPDGHGLGILATGVRRESRAMIARKRRASPTALCGRSAEASGDDLPVAAVDTGGGRCSTMRRTEDSTQAPSFIRCSRKVLTWAQRKAVRAARSAGRVAAVLVQMLRLPRFARPAPGGAHQARRVPLEYLVFSHCDHVLESLALEELKDPRSRKATIEAHPQPRSGEGRAQFRQQPREDAQCPHRGADIAGAQHIREQVLLGFC
jgi:hypothetical protein